MTTTTPVPPSDPGRRSRRGLFWPLVLIGIGLVALLANYGVITGLSIASILALWPVLLILLGIDIAFARRWPVPTLAAEVAIIVTGWQARNAMPRQADDDSTLAAAAGVAFVYTLLAYGISNVFYRMGPF